MKHLGFIILVGLFVLLGVGCGSSSETDVAEIVGPALILFYTDS